MHKLHTYAYFGNLWDVVAEEGLRGSMHDGTVAVHAIAGKKIGSSKYHYSIRRPFSSAPSLLSGSILFFWGQWAGFLGCAR